MSPNARVSLGALGSRWTDVERDFPPSAIELAASWRQHASRGW